VKANVRDDRVAQVWEYWHMLGLYKWWIFLSTLGFSLASIVAVALLPDYYQAKTTILVDPQKIPDTYVRSTVTSSPTERLNTLSQQVLSTTRLQKIIDKFQLYPELRAARSHEELIEYMRHDIKMEVKEGSGDSLGTFAITFQGRDRSVVAAVADELAATFINWNLHSREELAAGTTEFMTSHLQQAKEDLERQETKLQQFKMGHPGEMPEQQQSNLQSLTGLHIALQANADALNRLDEERTLLMRLPEAAPSAGIGPAPVSERTKLEGEKSQLEEQLSEMEVAHTKDHPDVQRASERLRRVTERLASLPEPLTEPALGATKQSVSKGKSSLVIRLEMVDRNMQRLRDEQARIKSQIAQYQAKVDAVPLREQQLVELTRNYQVSKQQYESLLDKTYGAEMAADLEQKQKAERFTILDAARMPEKPFKPHRRQVIGAAMAMSLFLSCGLVILKEQLSTTVKTERELKQILPTSVGVFASIPRIEAALDRRHRFWTAILALTVAMLACVAVAGFLWKVRPIL